MPAWDSAAALAVAGDLGSGSQAQIDWDEGAGESWVRLVAAARVVALVSINFPLVLAERQAELGSIHSDVVTVIVDSLEDTNLSCSMDVLVSVFDDRARLEVLNPEHFSAYDLWYATV